jgi:hypothetical protein
VSAGAEADDGLLGQAVAAHGGSDRFDTVSEIAVRLSAGGLAFASRFAGRALRDVLARVSTAEPTTIFEPYPRQGRQGTFEGDRVRIVSAGGDTVAARSEPRAAFTSLRRKVAWDDLDLLYFAGYALWNYLTAPFLLARPGFESREGEPWLENGERWRRLHVRFPDGIATHSRDQTFYFDANGVLRRLDYTAEVFGSWAKAAHYCLAYETVSGLLIPVRRRVVPRRRSGRAWPGPTLVWIRLTDIQLQT